MSVEKTPETLPLLKESSRPRSLIATEVVLTTSLRCRNAITTRATSQEACQSLWQSVGATSAGTSNVMALFTITDLASNGSHSSCVFVGLLRFSGQTQPAYLGGDP